MSGSAKEREGGREGEREGEGIYEGKLTTVLKIAFVSESLNLLSVL